MGFLRRLFGAGGAEAGPPADDAAPDGGDPAPHAGDLPFDVEPGGRGDWQYEITFDDVVAHIEEDRVSAFVELLGADAQIDEAVHEDREIVLIKAGRLPLAAMRAAGARAWAAAGEQVGVRTLEDWESEQEA